MNYKDISRLIRIILDIAEIVEEKGENGEIGYLEGLELGYRGLTTYLRKGAKAVIELQGSYRNAKYSLKYKSTEVEELNQALEEIFGDRYLDCFTDKERKEIKIFITKLLKEAEETEEK